MGQDLKSRVRDIAHAGHTKLSADLISAGCILVTSQDSISEVTPLLSEVPDEGGSV